LIRRFNPLSLLSYFSTFWYIKNWYKLQVTWPFIYITFVLHFHCPLNRRCKSVFINFTIHRLQGPNSKTTPVSRYLILFTQRDHIISAVLTVWVDIQKGRLRAVILNYCGLIYITLQTYYQHNANIRWLIQSTCWMSSYLIWPHWVVLLSLPCTRYKINKGCTKHICLHAE
jgi:hypothetical protein